MLTPNGGVALGPRNALHELRAYFGWALVFSAGVNILYLSPTLYMMQVYDRVVPTSGVTTLALVSIVAAVALAVLSLLDWLRARVLLKAGLRIERSLAREILSRVIDAPDGQARKQAMREFDHVRAAVSGQAATALFDLPWTPLYLEHFPISLHHIRRRRSSSGILGGRRSG